MADTDFKIVNEKYYVYPNTELEKSFMNGTASFPNGKELYVQIGTAYDAIISKYTAEVGHIHNYDYYLVCVRKPEWLSDTPTPPQPTYRAITINDPYSISYVLQYTSGETVNPSTVEVGKQVIFSTNDTAYTQTFPEGLDVSVYGTLPSGATAYKFRMPDYDVTITITEVQPEPTGYHFNLVNGDSINVELYKSDWSSLDISQPISGGTQIIMLVGNYDYEATFSPSMEQLQPKFWDKNNSRWQYVFNMPSNDLTVSIATIPTVTFTVENPESKQINWNADGRDEWHNDTQTVHVGANIGFICWQNTDKITFGSPIEYTEEYDRDGRYQYHFIINEDLTVTTGNRNGAGIYYNGNTDITIQVGETPTYPTLENPNSVTPITYTSSNTDLATVDSNGNVNLTSGVVGEAHITATFGGDSTYDFTGTHFRINVIDGVNIAFLKTGAVESKNVRIYNISKQQDASAWTQTRPNDTIFVVGAAQDDKVMYRDSSNNWTTLNSSYTTETVDGQSENGIEFTMPSSINPFDYALIMTNADDLYDITGAVNGNLYNETGLNGWWYYVEDPEHPGTYSTKYPNGTMLGIESRNGETYTINPEQTLLEGGSVGKYIVMPSAAIEITKTN